VGDRRRAARPCVQWQESGARFFGKRVDYGRQPQEFGRTALWVLPSTSGAASGFWDEKHWHDLAASLRSASD
jgi:TDG/mug DNA glycosylase family protein